MQVIVWEVRDCGNEEARLVGPFEFWSDKILGVMFMPLSIMLMTCFAALGALFMVGRGVFEIKPRLWRFGDIEIEVD